VQAATDLRIVDHAADWGDAFERLNREWLERYFRVEPVDEEVLSNPVENIINEGGAVLYVLMNGDPVGTVALKYQGDQVYELTKMAVTSGHQGQGLGRKLLCAAVDRFAELGGKLLYLESHSSLTAALTLYESAGFRHEPPPSASDYERADTYMVYHGR
jgi:putative acetyltransferase